MHSSKKGGKFWIATLRLLTKLLATGLAMLILAMAIGEGGPPNPFAQPFDVAVELFAMLVICLGLIIAWRWELVGGAMILLGTLVFHIVEGTLWFNWVFGLFALTGLLFVACGASSAMSRGNPPSSQ